MSRQTPVLAERAKELYVKKQLTFKEIGRSIGVSERTVRIWRDKDGSWEREREAYIESRKSFHEDLYDFGRELMISIRDDFRAGNKVEAARWQCLGGILKFIVKPQDYESVRASREAESDKRSNRDLALSILTAMGVTDSGDDDESDDDDG